MAGRNWRFVGVLLLVLADGALAIAFRYRGERVGAQGVLVATAVFGGLGAVLVVALVMRWRMKLSSTALAFLVFAATTTALVMAWTSLPCRFKSCEWFLVDEHLRYWSASAAALATAAIWGFYAGRRSEARPRWGLRAAGFAISVVLAAFWAMAAAGPQGPGHFACSSDLIPYDAPDPIPTPEC